LPQIIGVGRNKLKQFAENETFDHVVEPPFEQVWNNQFPLKGVWNKEHFAKKQPIILELGCGKGEYTVGLAKLYPNNNFIGLDIKGYRIWTGASQALELGLDNVSFLRSKVDLGDKLFGENEVDEIWLTFSDPQPKRAKKRLTSPFFINQYKKFLKPGGIIHLKTDSRLLANYTLEQIEEHQYALINYSFRVHEELNIFPEDIREALDMETYFEGLWRAKGYPINYVSFRL